MKGSNWSNFKSAAIAVLFGILAARGIVWRSLFCEICGGYLVAQIIWVFLVAYDEIQRKRRKTMRHYRKRVDA